MKANNMKKYFIFIIASFLIGVSVFAFQPATLFIETWQGNKRVAVYDEITAKELFKQGYKLDEGLLGTSITTIQGSDTLKNSRTTINDNFAALNAGKIEISTTTLPLIATLSGLTSASSLATVGTITSGTWSGTAIAVSKNGTGTTSPTQYLVPIGNGANGYTHASSTGTSGQFLTSNGVGAYPSWQSSTVNQSANYTWTGIHDFQATTTGIKIIEAYTASTTITKMNAVYMATSTGNILQSNASYTASSTYYQFNGFALNNAVDGGTVYVQTAGIVSGFTGLTKGLEYYIDNTAGAISSTMGNVPIKIGNAVSTTQILINREKKLGGIEYSTSKDNVTVYSYTDGQVSFGATQSGGALTCSITINGTNYFNAGGSNTAGEYANASFAVRQNDTWNVNCTNFGGFDLIWRANN